MASRLTARDSVVFVSAFNKLMASFEISTLQYYQYGNVVFSIGSQDPQHLLQLYICKVKTKSL